MRLRQFMIHSQIRNRFRQMRERLFSNLEAFGHNENSIARPDSDAGSVEAISLVYGQYDELGDSWYEEFEGDFFADLDSYGDDHTASVHQVQVFVDVDQAVTVGLIRDVFDRYLNEYKDNARLDGERDDGERGDGEGGASPSPDAKWNGQRFFYARAEEVDRQTTDPQPVEFRIRFEATPRNRARRRDYRSLYRVLTGFLT
ncbi:MAG: hypothetical protein M1831_003258 [Alyxoria varia]|nr:MAG: hypothetical protein M1831_003258 [Alyxoria varia]